MNAKNKKLMVDVEQAITDLSNQAYRDGMNGVIWNKSYDKMREKVRELLLKLEKDLP